MIRSRMFGVTFPGARFVVHIGHFQTETFPHSDQLRAARINTSLTLACEGESRKSRFIAD